MAEGKNITIYSTPTCAYCHQAKRYLTEKGAKYMDKDIAADIKARDEMIRISGQMGAPVIVVDGHIIIGFNRPKLDELLKS